MIVAIIPARGGSKRIPKKNIRPFCGRPILSYVVEVALQSGLFDRVIVSTDSPEVAAVATEWGAEVPFMRPLELANDTATTIDVLIHAVEWLQANGGCDLACCIYPTSPMLRGADLAEGLEMVRGGKVMASMSVVEFAHPPQRALRINRQGAVEFVDPATAAARTQDLEALYHDAGSFYWCNAKALLESRDFFSLSPTPIGIPLHLAQDIDTEDQWDLAQMKYQFHQRGANPLHLPPNALPVVLGTAQLGFPYGIANRTGRPTAESAMRLLCAAWAGGVRLFDTAQAYGASEHLLGDFFGGLLGFSSARFITKLHPHVDIRNEADIRTHVEESLSRLKVPQLWTLMLHNESHLDHWNHVLGATLRQLRVEGLVQHIGASVYSVARARQAIESPDFEVVSIPAGPLDRRMSRAGISELAKKMDTCLLVRSVFLQGLVFMSPQDTPENIPQAQRAIELLRGFCDGRHTSVVEFAFQYARECFPQALIVLGADTAEQAAENCRLANLEDLSAHMRRDWDAVWPEDVEELCDPSKWPPTTPRSSPKS